MSGSRFLVSLREVLDSERILRCRSLIKENINFWEEVLTFENQECETCNNKLYKTLDYWPRDILNFDLILRHILCIIFKEKIFLYYSINWPNFVVWFPLLLEILVNMCITIVCFPGCDVINFEINLIFLIRSFFCMTKNSRQKILRSKRAFKVK